MERVADSLELEHLRRISVICITDPDKLVEQERQEKAEEEKEEVSSFSQLTSSPSELSEWKMYILRDKILDSIELDRFLGYCSRVGIVCFCNVSITRLPKL